jgi:hypothetical protein
VFPDDYPAAGQGCPPTALVDLEHLVAQNDGVVFVHGPRVPDREDLFQATLGRRHKGRASLPSCHREFLIKLGHISTPPELVRGLNRVHATQAQLLRQAPLPGAEISLATAPGLRRIGRDGLRLSSFSARPTWVNRLRSTGPPAFGVTKKWLARSQYIAQKTPFPSTTSRIAASTVRVDSSSTNWA